MLHLHGKAGWYRDKAGQVQVLDVRQHHASHGVPVVMLPDPAKQQELVKTVPGTTKTTAVGGKTAEKVGRLTVVSGETDRKAYELTGHLTVIGAEDTATVRLTGWFAPKNAALISLQGSGYFISLPEGGKKITVNGEVVQGKKSLHDGDVIIIAGVHFQFSLK